jgi:hypothetical protein
VLGYMSLPVSTPQRHAVAIPKIKLSDLVHVLFEVLGNMVLNTKYSYTMHFYSVLHCSNAIKGSVGGNLTVQCYVKQLN